MNAPPFLADSVFSAADSYSGAMIPSDTTPFRKFAVSASTGSESATKSW